MITSGRRRRRGGIEQLLTGDVQAFSLRQPIPKPPVPPLRWAYLRLRTEIEREVHPMGMISLSAVAVVSCLALAAPTFAAANRNSLTGTDGPGFTITMNKKTVKAGTYKIVIHDRSSIHNFHLTGPGVNKKTSVKAVGTTTWTVKLKKGTYKFVCDPHRTIMRGVLRVT